MSGLDFSTWARQWRLQLDDHQPTLFLAMQGIKLCVSAVLLPVDEGSRDAGYWVLVRANWVPRPAPPTAATGTTPTFIEGSLLVALTGCAPDNAWVGCNARPQAAVPASFQRHGQVCCGVYSSMLMAIWTAAATGHNMQLLSPLDVSQPAGPCLAGHGPLQKCPAPMAVSITACMCTVVDVAS